MLWPYQEKQTRNLLREAPRLINPGPCSGGWPRRALSQESKLFCSMMPEAVPPWRAHLRWFMPGGAAEGRPRAPGRQEVWPTGVGSPAGLQLGPGEERLC